METFLSACGDAGDTCAGRATEVGLMADNARIPLAVGFLVGALTVTLLFQTISTVALVMVAAGGGLAWVSVRYSPDFSSPKNAAQLGLGLGFLFGLPVYYVLATIIMTVDLLLTAATGG